MTRSQDVSLRWLAADAQAMNVDHLPADDFEKAAVKAIASGEEAFDSVQGNVYRRAGRIRLSSGCLKCHLPSRTNNKDRAAALVITMEIEAD